MAAMWNYGYVEKSRMDTTILLIMTLEFQIKKTPGELCFRKPLLLYLK